MKKLIFVIFFCLLLMSCTQQTTEGDTIKLGAILSLTNNDYVFVADAMQKGVILAEEELNANGGVLGKKVEISV